MCFNERLNKRVSDNEAIIAAIKRLRETIKSTNNKEILLWQIKSQGAPVMKFIHLTKPQTMIQCLKIINNFKHYVSKKFKGTICSNKWKH